MIHKLLPTPCRSNVQFGSVPPQTDSDPTLVQTQTLCASTRLAIGWFFVNTVLPLLGAKTARRKATRPSWSHFKVTPRSDFFYSNCLNEARKTSPHECLHTLSKPLLKRQSPLPSLENPDFITNSSLYSTERRTAETTAAFISESGHNLVPKFHSL